jgi:hypothetical protein
VSCFASQTFDGEKLDYEWLLKLVHLPSLTVIFAGFETISTLTRWNAAYVIDSPCG